VSVAVVAAETGGHGLCPMAVEARDDIARDVAVQPQRLAVVHPGACGSAARLLDVGR
jgi:hypothetical protein